MKKIQFLLTVLLIGLFQLANAEPIDSTVAKQLATRFYNSRVSSTDNSSRQAATIAKCATAQIREQGTRQLEERDCYYIVNFDHGFVIIAADDRVEPILGYSTTSAFHAENIPENVAAWMEGYRQQIASVISENNNVNEEVSQHWYNLKHNIIEPTRSAIGPLVQTQWDQEPYYNQLCPVDASNTYSGHAVTGCVATAMAQVIRYWEYPTTGSGTHTYTTHANATYGYADYGTLTVNYSAAHYDYSLMPPTLSSSSSAAQINEVAKLMYHCGVSVNMNYGPSGSGAAYVYIPDALMTNFAYPSGIQCVFKSSYTDNAWKNLIKNELNNLRPVIYGGSNSSGSGHSFVCDGYNGEYFHINWGWGGNNDGYFLIPGPGGFINDQNATIGISAPTPTIRCADHTISLSSPVNGSSEIQNTTVIGYNLSSSIIVTASDNFTIGSNSSSLGNSATLPSSGGTLYVQYDPSSTTAQYESGYIALSSGSAHDTIHLFGTSYNTVCLPPKNLNASVTSSRVNLSWTAPSQNTPASTTISWESNYDGPMYFADDITFCMLQRYEVSDLSSFNQHYLNSISFMPLEGITSFRIVAYQGGSYDGSFHFGEQVVNQEVPISKLRFNEWNTIQLLNPYIIDNSRELWFGVIAHEDDDAIVPLGSSSYVDHKGGILGFYYGPYNEFANFQYVFEMNDWGLSYNIPLKADIEKISGNVVRYDIYKDNSYVDNTTNTYYQHNQALSNPSYYDVYAVWDNYCSEHARVLATPTTPCLPSVTTSTVTQTSNTTATCGGNVLHEGNISVTARGVCWSTSHNPTISNSHTTNGSGSGAFTSSITGLTPGTTYYVRAYATNSQGTNYGEEQSVTLYYVVPKTGNESFTVSNNTITVYDHAGPYNNYERGCTGILTLNTGDPSQTFEITGSYDICYYYNGSNPIDNLYIYDGSSTSGTLLAQLSEGGTISTPITSTQSSITIRFSAPSGWTIETIFPGFMLNVKKLGVTTVVAPTVATNNVSNVAQTTATCGGNVTADGGASVTARGVCWSTSENPTVGGSGCQHSTDGSGTGTFTSSITGLNPNTTYYVRAYATNSAGTSYGEQKNFTTNCNTVTISISGNTTINYGGSTTLTVSGASSYVWKNGSTTIGTNASITVNPTSTTTYTVTGTNNYGCTGNKNVTVTVNNLAPTVSTNNVSNIGTTTATCGGNVTADGGASVTARGVCWSTSENPTVGGSGCQHSSDGSGTGTFTSSITGLNPNTTYYVRAYATNSAGTSYGEQKSFTTNCNTVTISISGNTTINYGGSTTLTASGASSYVWKNGSTTIGTNASITVNPTENTTYTVTGTNQYNCTGTTNVTVTVNSTGPTVTTSNVSNIGTTTATCGGNVTADNGATVTARGVCWSTSENPTVGGSGCQNSSNGSGTGTFTSSITGLTPNTTHYVRAYATNSAGTSYGEQKSFTTNCNTVTISISGNTTINYGGSTTLTASGASSYVWKNGSSTIGEEASIIVNPTTTTTYTVTGKDQYNCTGTANVTVTVNSLAPTVTTNNVSNIGTTTATCGGNVTADNGATVTARGVCWSTSENPTVGGSGCQNSSNGSGTGTFSSSITGLTPNTTYYVRAYATNSAGTNYGEQKTFKTSCNAINLTITGTTTINYGGSTTLTASGASSYVWKTGSTTIGENASITVSPSSTTTYTVTGTDQYGCNATANVTVTVNSMAPTVTTNDITNITETSATCGGVITNNGGSSVTASGICWSTTPNPTMSDNLVPNTSGSSSFSCNITGLTPYTTYYVRAYATNSTGVAYGEERSFSTINLMTIPVNINFEDASRDLLWYVDNHSDANQWHFGQVQGFDNRKLYISGNHGTSNKYINEASQVSTSFWVIIPASGANLSFDYRVNGEAGKDYLQVDLSNSHSSIYNTMLQGVSEWSHFSANIFTNNTDTLQLSFIWVNDEQNAYQCPAAIDNIVIDLPVCVQPSNLTVTTDTTSAHISWTAGTEDQATFKMEYKTEDDTEWETRTINGNSCTLTNLSLNTTYQVRVKALCGENNWSDVTTTSFTTLDNCLPVSDIIYSNLSNSVTLTWTAGGDEENWQLQFKQSSANDNEWLTVPVYTNPTTMLSGLMEETDYDIRIKAMCDTNDENQQSTWTTISIRTGCEAIDIPYSQVMGGSQLPECWTSYAFSSQSTFVESVSDNSWLMSPTLTIPDNGNPVYLRFECASLNDFEVLASYQGSQPDNFSTIYTGGATSTMEDFQAHIITLPDLYKGKDIYLMFRPGDGNFRSNYFEVSQCADIPTNLRIVDVTDNSFSITWDAVMSEEWIVEYKTESSFEWTEVAVTQSYHTIDLLTQNILYQVRVKSLCTGNHVSNYSETLNVKTLCGTREIPYTEYFSNPSFPPDCWSQEHIVGTQNWYMSYNTAFFADDSDQETKLITPVFDLSRENAVLLKFTHGQPSYNGVHNEMSVYYRVHTDSAWVLLEDYTNEYPDYWTPEEIVLPSAALSSSCQFAFDGKSFGSVIYLDGIEIIPVPSCGTPVLTVNDDVVANITPSAFGNTPIAYELQIGELRQTVTSNSVNLSSLFPLASRTRYEASVRAICGEGDTSSWSEPVYFLSSCTATDLPYTESFESTICPADCWSLYYGSTQSNTATVNEMTHSMSQHYSGYNSFRFSSYNSASDYNEYLISPELDVNAPIIISFFYSNTTANDKLYFGYSTTNNNIESFTWTTQNLPYSGGADSWSPYTANLPAETKYVAFKYYGNCMYYTYLDNVTIDYAPTCGVPSVTVTDAQATITAGDHGTPTAYELQIGGVSRFVNANNTPVNLYTLFNLNQGEEYEISVRAICGVGDTSAWSDPLTSFSISPSPLCNTPSISMNGTVATITPDGSSNPESYELRINGVTANTNNTVVDLKDLFTLATNFHYNVSVRANCGTMDGVSSWSPEVSFYVEGTSTTSLPDIQVTAITPIADACSLGDPITIKVTNMDAVETITDMTLYYQVNEETPVREYVQLPTPLNFRDSMYYTFATLPVYTENDNYISVWAIAGEDFTHHSTEAGVIYSQDFEDEDNMMDISYNDADGDGHNWRLSSSYHNAHSGNYFMGSESFDNISNITLYPENWLILPPVLIPEGEVELNWWISATSNAYSHEHYEVVAITSVGNVSLFDETLENAQWANRSVNLSSFAGQNIQIAFIHNQCSDLWMLLLDDISISKNIDFQIATYGPVKQLEPATVPYIEDFSDEIAYHGWTPFDANNDNISMNLNNNINYSFNDNLAANDWMISPCINLPAGNYAVSYEYKANSNLSESFELFYGNGSHVSDMTSSLASHSFNGTNGTTVNNATNTITITEDGTYNFGFHATSLAGNMGFSIDNFEIYPVVNVLVISGENGTVSPNGNLTVHYGEDLSLSIIPDVTYHVAGVWDNSNLVIDEDMQDSRMLQYTLHNITTPDTVIVSFTPSSCTHHVEVDTACEVFTWHGNDYTESDIYFYPYTTLAGVACIDTLYLTIDHYFFGDTDVVACESYEWHGVNYDESGVYTYTNECSSADTLHLTINIPTVGDTSATVCGSFNWYNHSGLTESGEYTHTMTNVAGCDSVVTLHLTVNTATEGDTSATVCGSFNWYNHTGLTQSGDYTHTMTNAAGCDSIVTLHLTVNTATEGDTSATICGSFNWYNHTGLTQSGDYTHTMTSAAGCDSVVTLHLTVNPLPSNPTFTTTDNTSCTSTNGSITVNTPTGEGYTYILNNGTVQPDNSFNALIGGDYTVTVIDNNGCSASSMVTINTIGSTVTASASSNTPCVNDTLHLMASTNSENASFSWSGPDNYISSEQNPVIPNISTNNVGIYTVKVTDIPTGCSTNAIITASVKEPVTKDIYKESCGVYQWNDEEYDHSDDYIQTFTAANGCDSIVTLHLTVNTATEGDTSATVCGSFDWYNYTGLTQSGDYTHTMSNAADCDSIVTLHLTVNTATEGDTSATVCGSFDWYNYTGLTQSGDYTHTISNAMGCDSVVTLHLTVNQNHVVTDTKNICPSELPYTWNGIVFNGAGSQNVTLQTVNGCDSIVIMILTVNQTHVTTDNQTICESELPYTWNGVTFNAAGVSTATLQDANGCDSTVIMTLSVNPSYEVNETTTICESELPYTWNGIVFNTAGSQSITMQAVNGCDSIVTMTLAVNPTYMVTDARSICPSELPYTWNGIVFNGAGSQNVTLQTVNGCDSIVIMILTVNQTHVTTDSQTICESELPYTWNGVTFTAAGVNTATLQDANGCDSTVIMTLSVNPSYEVNEMTTICESELPYTWNGIVFNTAGSQSINLQTGNGCDSVVTMILTVTPTYAVIDAMSICQNALPYTWNGITFNEGGTQTVTLQSVSGCDSVVTMTLTVNTATEGDTSATVCGSFDWYSYTGLTESGDYTHTMTNAAGCDSVVTLHLTVNESVTIELYLTISEDDLPYTYGDTTFEPGSVQTGDYTFYLTSETGCDSIIVLHLTVLTGIDEHLMTTTMNVYPNPTTDKINIQLSRNNEQMGTAEIQVFDVYGKLLETVETVIANSLQTVQIDLSRYASGVYLIKAVANGNVLAVRKVVKQR